MNKLIYTLFILLIISCNITGVNKSAKIIQNIETKNIEQTYMTFSPQNKGFYNKLYQDFFKDRKFINKYIKQKKIRNFIIQESFNINDASGIPLYNAFIIYKDSVLIYNYSISKESKTIRRKDVKTFSLGNPFFYTSDNNLYYVNKSLSDNKNSFDSYYISSYINNRLDYLSKINHNKDSILLKRNNSKTLIDLNTTKWFTSNGICMTKNNIMECRNISKKSMKNEKGEYIYCDTIK